MKVVGVLGGMGPAAGVDFLRRIVELTPATRDQDHLHVIMDGDPSVPDRTEAIIGRGADPSEHLVWMAKRLQSWGADLLVMPCNSAHAFAAAIVTAVSIPLVDWPGEAAAAVAREQSGPVGLLATSGTVAAGVYLRPFADRRIELLVPDRDEQQLVTEAIDLVKRDGPRSSEAFQRLLEASRGLAEAGATASLLACTELSVLAAAWSGTADQPAPQWFDAAQFVAASVVQMAWHPPASAATPCNVPGAPARAAGGDHLGLGAGPRVEGSAPTHRSPVSFSS